MTSSLGRFREGGGGARPDVAPLIRDTEVLRKAWDELLGHVREQKCERRLLTTAILFRHRSFQTSGLKGMRRNVQRAKERRAGGVLLWQKGELYERQRRRRLRLGLRALMHNTAKHRLELSASHYSNRLLALVFGAWSMWYREEDAGRTRAEELASSADLRRLERLGVLRWLSTIRKKRLQADNHKIACIFPVLVHFRRGLFGFARYASAAQKRSAHVRPRPELNPEAELRRHSLQHYCKMWMCKTARRQVLTLRALRGNVELARSAIGALQALVERRRQVVQFHSSSTVDKTRRRRSGLRRWIQWVFASRRARWVGRQCSRVCVGARLSRGLRHLYSHRVNHQISLETAAVADEFAKRMPVTVRSFFRQWRAKSRSLSCSFSAQGTRATLASRQAALAGRRRGILAWLRHLKARLLQSLLLQRALDHQAYVWAFRRRSSLLQRWMVHRMQRCVLEERRLSLANWCYTSRRKRQGMAALRHFVRLARRALSSSMLGEFKFSRRVTGRAWRHVHSHGLERRAARECLLRSLIYWKLFRFGNALAQWRGYVAVRKSQRREWLASQHRHKENMALLGCRLWLTVAAERTKSVKEVRQAILARKVVRQWRGFVLRARVASISPFFYSTSSSSSSSSSSFGPPGSTPLEPTSASASSQPLIHDLSRAAPRPLLPEYEALARPLRSGGFALRGSAVSHFSDDLSPPRPPKSLPVAFQSPQSVADSGLHDSPSASVGGVEGGGSGVGSGVGGETAETRQKRLELAREILQFVQDFQNMV